MSGHCLPRWSSVAAIASLLLSACAGDMVPGGKRTAHRPPSPAPSKFSIPRANSPEYLQCAANLRAINVHYSALPDQNFGNGCATYGVVKLLDIGVPTTNLGAMTCPLAAQFAAWARYGVEPAARLILGSEVVRIETFGTYNCRNIAGSARLSEHARGNAVDISAFLLADGRRISVTNGWNGDTASARFLRIVRASACKRFRTVLSPDYNAAHHDHLHFDMGGAGGYCR
jgi:hypothetical protein